jgi:hypothetical protein
MRHGNQKKLLLSLRLIQVGPRPLALPRATSLLNTSMTRLERMLPTTSIARRSRVNSSITARHFTLYLGPMEALTDSWHRATWRPSQMFVLAPKRNRRMCVTAFEATTATRRILEIESFKYSLGVLSMFAMPGAASQQISTVSGFPAPPRKNRLEDYAVFAALGVRRGVG